MTLPLHQQLAFAVAHVVGEGFTAFMFPLHHIILPNRIAGAFCGDESGKKSS